MSFLGRSLEEKVEEGSGGEGEMGKQRSRKKIYAGVVAFCLPPALASRGEGAASEEYQVWKKQVIFCVSLTPPPPSFSLLSPLCIHNICTRVHMGHVAVQTHLPPVCPTGCKHGGLCNGGNCQTCTKGGREGRRRGRGEDTDQVVSQ